MIAHQALSFLPLDCSLGALDGGHWMPRTKERGWLHEDPGAAAIVREAIEVKMRRSVGDGGEMKWWGRGG